MTESYNGYATIHVFEPGSGPLSDSGPEDKQARVLALAVQVYDEMGPSAVERLFADKQLAYCFPCEFDTPTIYGVCAVCSTVRPS